MTNRALLLTRTTPSANQPVIGDLDLGIWSENSPVVGGSLVLKENPCNIVVDRLLRLNMIRAGNTELHANAFGASRNRDYAMPYPDMPQLPLAEMRNRINAKFDGKLRKGHASLGVSIASWEQSHEMIEKRLKDAQRALDRTALRMVDDRRLLSKIRKDRREPLANQFLEGKFGWGPLVEDISAGLNTVIQQAIPPSEIVARGKCQVTTPWHTQSNVWTKWDGLGTGTYKAKVAISNPNLWLANRAGLLNLPGVAWDLVPWSFVVNMFGNFNQLLSSMTNEVGLDITDRSYTETVRMLTYRDHYVYYGGTAGWATSKSVLLRYQKVRTLNAAPPLSLVLKVPKADWGLLAIGSALVVQKIDRLNKLLRFV